MRNILMLLLAVCLLGGCKSAEVPGQSVAQTTAPAPEVIFYINGEAHAFRNGYSAALTELLGQLEYSPHRVCRCLPEYKVDTELGTGYGISLKEGYARCEQGQAKLTQEQEELIKQILQWLEQ